jgi:predicted nuclease of predicted toxin-antitoxin system
VASFYLDNDVAVRLAEELREMGHEATTARQLGAESEPDWLHLLTAADHGWILVTHNWRDFRLLHGAWIEWRRAWRVQNSHAGILVLFQAQDQQQREEYAPRLQQLIGRQTDPLHKSAPPLRAYHGVDPVDLNRRRRHAVCSQRTAIST